MKTMLSASVPLSWVQPLVQRIDRLGRRDRLALTLGMVGVAIGLQLQVLQPMQARRTLMETAVTAEASAQQQAQASALQAHQQAQATAQAELARQRHTLAALGLQSGSSLQTLASFLQRGLTGQPVKLIALKNLPVQPLGAAVPDAPQAALPLVAALNAASAPLAAVPSPVAPAASANTGGVTLYRHRVELQIEGPLPALTQAIDVLERRMLPLRVEHVRLASPEDRSDTLQATVVMTLVNEERTWLML